jgi:hypothetical protein
VLGSLLSKRGGNIGQLANAARRQWLILGWQAGGLWVAARNCRHPQAIVEVYRSSTISPFWAVALRVRDIVSPTAGKFRAATSAACICSADSQRHTSV